MNLAGIVDSAIEIPIVTSFTKLGYDVRKRTDHWRPLETYDLTGKTIVVTGATSGLGRHAAVWFAELGARVIVTGRRPERVERAATEIANESGGKHSHVVPVGADMGELDQVRRLAGEITAATDRLDVLVHNAGALSDVRRTNADGIEATVASQVLGPFLLTSLLTGLLTGRLGRVITVSSGGMYAARSTVDDLQMPAGAYRGSEQYARAKRAQVTLNQLWAQHVPASQTVFHAMHPGWADTPGVEASLPRFRSVMGPLLRSPEQGADTIVWLASDPRPARTSGEFWLDRRSRSIHKLPSTRRSDTEQLRARLWNWCVEQSGADPELTR